MRTPLADLHEAQGARLIEFVGWQMPVHYGSQIEEHHAVRQAAGCFDVSHMAVVDIEDSQGDRLLRRLLTGNVDKLSVGEAMYTLMLNDSGGVIDDLIVYKRQSQFRLVINAGTTQKDLSWMRQCGESMGISNAIMHRDELCIIAVQGPKAIDHVVQALSFSQLSDLAKFSALEANGYFIARTGYTGEDGVEVICSAMQAKELWKDLVAAGVQPAGLGARDSLRLEAGLNLYGHDMTEDTNPYEARLAWTIDWEDSNREFIGKSALESIRVDGAKSKLIGLKLQDRGIPREGYEVLSSAEPGIVTSGTFSPTLQVGIALARVPKQAKAPYAIRVREREIPAKITRLPFFKT